MVKMRKLQLCLLSFLFSFQFAACAQEQATKTDNGPYQPQKSNTEIADYVRKALNVPTNVTIEVKQEESETRVPGLKGIMIEFRSSQGSQNQTAWITPDQKLIIGRTFDMKVDPYDLNWKKVSLENVPTTGAPTAKVTIVEYSDFQCPFCSRAHVTVKELLDSYQGKVKVAYKHLPLTNIHNWAEDAAVASACVYRQNQEAFWKLSDYFFTNQKKITKETLSADVTTFAKEENLNSEELQKCLTERSTMDTVKADMAEAGSLGFGSTPSFVVNGRPVVGAIPLEQFKQIVDEALLGSQ